MPVEFQGFEERAFRFFSDLEKNNNKAWFDENRDRYELQVKLPFAALLASLPIQHQPFKVFRLNRDTRFSADKTPYKVSHSGAHTRIGGSYEYLQIDKMGLLLGAGHHVFEPLQLAQYRGALNERNAKKAFAAMAKALSQKRISLSHGITPPLKSAPRGTEPNHPMIEWLRWKGCVAMARIPHSEMRDGPTLVKQVTKWLHAVEPLNAWLDKYIT
jgi:uncharacterized protein (TIGR02453 family)